MFWNNSANNLYKNYILWSDKIMYIHDLHIFNFFIYILGTYNNKIMKYNLKEFIPTHS